MNELPFTVVRRVIAGLDLADQLGLLLCSRRLKGFLDEGVITTIRSSRIPLTDEILRHRWFTNLRELNVRRRWEVTDLNHLSCLRVLNISQGCGVGDLGIKECLHLEKLDANGNPRITDVNHLSYLRVLDVSWGCGVGDLGIKECIRLEKLDAHGNPRITDLNHLSYHTLTQEIVDKEGLPPAVALTTFLEAISSVDPIVAFNDFHADALRAELRRHLPKSSLKGVVTLQRRWMSLAEMVGRPVKTPLEKLLATQQLYPIPSQRRIPRLPFSDESVVQ